MVLSWVEPAKTTSVDIPKLAPGSWPWDESLGWAPELQTGRWRTAATGIGQLATIAKERDNPREMACPVAGMRPPLVKVRVT